MRCRPPPLCAGKVDKICVSLSSDVVFFACSWKFFSRHGFVHLRQVGFAANSCRSKARVKHRCAEDSSVAPIGHSDCVWLPARCRRNALVIFPMPEPHSCPDFVQRKAPWTAMVCGQQQIADHSVRPLIHRFRGRISCNLPLAVS